MDLENTQNLFQFIKYVIIFTRGKSRNVEVLLMKSKVVEVSSEFPVSKKVVFSKLTKFKTLSYITDPYASFKPIDGDEELTWEAGKTFNFKVKIFKCIPFGKHTIRVIKFSKEESYIYTNEKNTYVPIWNHSIFLEELDDNRTKYTDRVEIYAGWKTNIVYMWAKLFYSHRQKKWLNLLKGDSQVNK